MEPRVKVESAEDAFGHGDAQSTSSAPSTFATQRTPLPKAQVVQSPRPSSSSGSLCSGPTPHHGRGLRARGLASVKKEEPRAEPQGQGDSEQQDAGEEAADSQVGFGVVELPLVSAHQESSEHEDDDGPLLVTSLDGDLPDDPTMICVKRVRATVNKYMTKLSEVGWHSSFKKPTLDALIRRFQAYESKIEGKFHVD
eukprot:6186316-Pyramimonas_sp.AAC.1